MAAVIDVAEQIVQMRGELDAKKLQKLVYYCQAWALVWIDRALFEARIEAWRDGPVIPDLFRLHKGKFFVASIPGGNTTQITAIERDLIDSVLGFYGDRSAEWLIERTHSEDPWRDARRGLFPFQSGHREITVDSMRRYYSSVSLRP